MSMYRAGQPAARTQTLSRRRISRNEGAAPGERARRFYLARPSWTARSQPS